VRSTSPLWN